jgi:hypothetical protein
MSRPIPVNLTFLSGKHPGFVATDAQLRVPTNDVRGRDALLRVRHNSPHPEDEKLMLTGMGRSMLRPYTFPLPGVPTALDIPDDKFHKNLILALRKLYRLGEILNQFSRKSITILKVEMSIFQFCFTDAAMGKHRDTISSFRLWGTP